jgi:transglutaminase-like putative cysteine protease
MKIALEHRTTYQFDRPIAIGPHVIRLRPARTRVRPIEAYSLTILPATTSSTGSRTPSATTWPAWSSRKGQRAGDHRRPGGRHGRHQPFDFFIEEYAETYPFRIPTSSPLISSRIWISRLGTWPVLDGWILPGRRADVRTPTFSFSLP